MMKFHVWIMARTQYGPKISTVIFYFILFPILFIGLTSYLNQTHILPQE